MLVLKIKKSCFYGTDHPEGIAEEEEYIKIKSLEQIQEIVDKYSKMPFQSNKFEIIKIEE